MMNEKILLKGEFALERENVRVDDKGRMAKTEHPKIFGNKNTNAYIKTDFAESQIELITPVFNHIEDMYNFLDNLQKIVSLNLNDEYLWPQSNPPILPKSDEDILVAQYGNEDTVYRAYLRKKYGAKRSILSGMHFNFSFDKEALALLCENFGIKEESSLYLKLVKYVTRYSWLFVYLTGASPKYHESFRNEKGEPNVKETFSCRNSEYGYKNLEDNILNYESVDSYISSIEDLVDRGKLARVSEFYMPARLKKGYRTNNDSENKNLSYIELRLIDLNPLYPLGINKDDLYMIHFLLLCFATRDDFDFNENMQRRAYYNKNQVSLYGKTKILNDEGEMVDMEEEALKLIYTMEHLSFSDVLYKDILDNIKGKLKDVTKTYSYIIAEGVNKEGYISYHIQKAKEYLEKAKETEFTLKGCEDLQLSTQCLIQSIIKKGLNYKILDKSQNFIYVEHDGQEEYIKEATRTSADSYSTVLVMENKHITKFVLDKKGIRTPQGIVLQSLNEGIEYYEKTKGMHLVVKPNNTNFGKGITILNKEYSFEYYKKALERAFKEDSVVLVEEFISGKEYRFLVIGDNVEGVLHRRGANVVGDGKSTIRELVKIKNSSPLRSTGYKAPFIEIDCGEFESDFLEKQGLSFESVPELGKLVFLRGNSNVSTGGDAIDFTGTMHDSYKQLAIKSAKCVNAKICGVDMMIESIDDIATESNYAIIELNFNPAIDIHCFPSEGLKRNVGDKVLELLFDMN